MKNILVIGYGNIGRTYWEILTGSYQSQVCVSLQVHNKNSTLPDSDSLDRVFTWQDDLAYEAFDLIISCVPEDTQFDVLKKLKGFSGEIYFEKPFGRTHQEFRQFEEFTKKNNMNVSVLLNRRAYEFSSPDESTRCFDFEQYKVDKIYIYDAQDPENFSQRRVKAFGAHNIFMANSIHLLDMALWRFGWEDVNVKRGISPKDPGIYCGELSLGDIDVEYRLNWRVPGPWGIEFCGSEYYSKMMPLETASVVTKTCRNDFTLKEPKPRAGFKPLVASVVAGAGPGIIDLQSYAKIPAVIEEFFECEF